MGRFFDAIDEKTLRFLFIILVVMGFWFSLISAVIALCLILVMRLLSVRVLVFVALIALSLMLGAWWLNDITFHSVHWQSIQLFSRLLHADSHLLSIPYVWLCALPYSLLFATILSSMMRWSLHLHHELRRVGAGQLPSQNHFMSSRKINHALERLQSAAVSEGAVLGVNHESGQPVILKDQDANLHTLAIGTTGSGKTTAIANIVESAIVRNHPVFYVDGKGDMSFAKAIQRFAEHRGVPFYLFSMKGASLKYNPIAFGGYTSKKDRIIELRTWSEDHYRKLAEGYLQTVFKLLDRRSIPVDLVTLSRYLDPEVLYQLSRQHKDGEAAKMIDSLESSYSQVSSLIREIRNMVESEVGHLFDTSISEVINLSQVLGEGGVVYFALQPLAFPAYAETLGKLIINDIKSLLASQLEENNPQKLFAFFDEFSIFAGDQIVNLINQGRSAGMHAVLATQSLSDIQRKGGNALLGQVLNNTNNYIIQRQNYSEDAEILANIIGTQSAFEVTSQLSTIRCSSQVGTVRQTREFIVHPDEIKRLERGERIFVNKQKFQVQRASLRQSMILQRLTNQATNKYRN